MFYATSKGPELEAAFREAIPQPALVLRARAGSLDIRALAVK